MRSDALRKSKDDFETETLLVDQSDAFAQELTDLSHKHGIGISGSSTVFVMEGVEDRTLAYKIDADGRLQLTST
jgi:hypothetical protein